MVTVTNFGSAPVHIGTTLIAGVEPTEFLIVNDSCGGATLDVGALCSVGIVFRPTAIGALTGYLRFLTGAGDAHDIVALSGAGVPPDQRQLIFEDDFESGGLSNWTVVVPRLAVLTLGKRAGPQPVDVGRTSVGSRLWLTVRVVNRLAGPVDVASVTLGGPQGHLFQLGEDRCSGTRVPAGESCSVSVGFTALAAGRATAEVAVTSSAGDARLTLTGEGRLGFGPQP